MQEATLTDDDVDGVSHLLTGSFGGSPQWYRQCFRHWWDANPAWNSRLPRGFIVKGPDGAVIAFTANIPFVYVLNGEARRCFVTGSTVVDPRWQSRGLSKLVGRMFAAQSDAALLIGTGSTSIALKMWTSVGMKMLDRSWPAASYNVIGSGSRLLEHAAAGRLPSLVTRAAGRMIDAASSIRSIGGDEAGLTTSIARGFVAADDASLASLRASHRSIFALRDAATLHWLYFGAEHLRETRVVFEVRKGAALVGYAAFKMTPSSLLLLECRTREADASLAVSLLRAAQRYASERGIAFIRVWMYTPMIQSAVRKLLGVSRSRPAMTSYVYRANVAIDEALWEATPGDGDLSIT